MARAKVNIYESNRVLRRSVRMKWSKVSRKHVGRITYKGREYTVYEQPDGSWVSKGPQPWAPLVRK